MATTTDTSLSGGPELDRLLQTLPTKVERNILRAALRAGGVVLRKEVRERVPRDSGDLLKSVRITSRAKRGEVQVSVKAGNSVAYYASMVEYGTRPHDVKVSDQDRGRGRRAGELASVSTVNRRSLQIGSNFVGPSVHHPGSRAKPFMRPAVDAGFLPAVEAVQAKIRERLTAQGINTPAPVPSDPQE